MPTGSGVRIQQNPGVITQEFLPLHTGLPALLTPSITYRVIFFFIILKIDLFIFIIYFWLQWVFIAACRLLIGVASLAGEHRL